MPEIQKEHRNLLQELKVIQENEHALQKDALSTKLKLEQIDGQIAEHNSKIKYWQKEVRSCHSITFRAFLGGGEREGWLLDQEHLLLL